MSRDGDPPRRSAAASPDRAGGAAASPEAPEHTLEGALNLLEIERLACERLPQAARDYYRSGSGDQVTLWHNRAAFDRLSLAYRVLVDVSRRDLATTVLGQPVSMPVLVAPTAFHAMAHPDGECGTARAAAAAGTVMVLSTLSNTPVEDVVAAAGSAPVWFQLYVFRDRGVTRALVERAAAAGATALVLTVDAPFLGWREADVRNRFGLPPGLTIATVPADRGEMAGAPDDSGLAAYFARFIDPSVTWADLEWLRSLTSLPLVIKGVVRADDARRAAAAGAAAIMVSNHGGRQLDTAPATIEVVGEVADAVGDAAEVYLDGGVRRGIDVIKAMALGARAVLVGRPVLWGLAAGGQAGALRVLEILRGELDHAMALCGCPDVGAITRDLVRRR